MESTLTRTKFLDLIAAGRHLASKVNLVQAVAAWDEDGTKVRALRFAVDEMAHDFYRLPPAAETDKLAVVRATKAHKAIRDAMLQFGNTEQEVDLRLSRIQRNAPLSGQG